MISANNKLGLSFIIILAIIIVILVSINDWFGREGTASWYGRKFKGHKTASGAYYDPAKLTAAHRSLPLGTKVEVTNLENKRKVIVEINDRGPYVPGRMIDLSQAAAYELGMKKKGLARVKIKVLSK